MRRSPEDAPSPIVPTSMPRPAATTPFMAIRPARMPTMDRPKMVIISSSGVRNSRTIGLAIRMNTVRKLAPTSPPNSDEAKAAESARAACPFLAMGKPSSTVAWLAEDPGIPIRTDAKVSDVGTTATIPTISARPRIGSMPNMNGKSRDSPAIPPRPGNTPIHNPIRTPRTR